MIIPYLNLARKWRSKNFDEIVGQEISVRILKNSLYLDQLFPVYLFSGQRGCGKTTTARVFAAAINCLKFTEFQKDPKNITIPCLTCESCVAMAAGSHPDFIEMDAASHTGVENVRTIIDAASLLPVMGRKKIYLIDEAHMLSKAAFNAFLKILEEPPASVLFILATTDIQKIIDTVRSRCFQLFFTAIELHALVKHLEHVCTTEQIEYESAALQLIVHETQGSARDALTMVEQIKFSHKKVSLPAVYALLGHMPEESVLQLFQLLIAHDVSGLLAYCEQVHLAQYDALGVWQKLQELIRTAMFTQYGVKVDSLFVHNEQFHTLVKSSSQDQLYRFMQVLHEYEMSLQKSTAQTALIEMMLLEMVSTSLVELRRTGQPDEAVQRRQEQKITQVVKPQEDLIQVTAKTVVREFVIPESANAREDLAKSEGASEVVRQAAKPDEAFQRRQDARWANFIEQIELLSDPLLISIFKQAFFTSHSVETGEVVIAFTQSAPFFTEWLVEAKAVWMPHLIKEFGQNSTLKSIVQAGTQKVASDNSRNNTREVIKNNNTDTKSNTVVQVKTTQTTVDVSDKEQWVTANALLETFGGTLTEVKDEQNII